MDASEYTFVNVGGFETIQASRSELATIMLHDCLAARERPDSLPSLVFSSNGQGIALAGRDDHFAETMRSATIIHADGMPVVLASRLTSAPLPERIATTDFFHDAAEVGTAHGLRFFMLGSTEEQNRKAIENIRERYPQLRIVGSHHGFFDRAEDPAICAAIRASKADVVWVALGKPHQEEWCVRNRDSLSGVGWLKTCGGLYAFIAGDSSRAPRWMQDVGLEWLYRAFRDPKRLGWRYITTNPYAFYRLLRNTKRTPHIRRSS